MFLQFFFGIRDADNGGSGRHRLACGTKIIFTYTQPQVSDLSNPSSVMGKFLSDTQYAFTLEPYANGTPTPTVMTKEVDIAVTAPFLLANPDSSKTEVVKWASTSGPQAQAPLVGSK